MGGGAGPLANEFVKLEMGGSVRPRLGRADWLRLRPERRIAGSDGSGLSLPLLLLLPVRLPISTVGFGGGKRRGGDGDWPAMTSALPSRERDKRKGRCWDCCEGRCCCGGGGGRTGADDEGCKKGSSLNDSSRELSPFAEGPFPPLKEDGVEKELCIFQRLAR